MSADPLSFFVCSDDSNSDSDESGKASDTETEFINKNNQAFNQDNLPPPLLALADAKTPEFVTSHIKGGLDWDNLVKTAPYVPPKEFKPWENVLPSVEAKSTVKSKKPDLSIVKGAPHTLTPAPPKAEAKVEVERVTSTKDHAVTWSKMYKDSGFSSAAAKRPRPEDEDADLAGFCHTDVDGCKNAFQSKHQKMSTPATFREKEKRKRDVGQSNRDKSFVEEEKRILKQNFD